MPPSESRERLGPGLGIDAPARPFPDRWPDSKGSASASLRRGVRNQARRGDELASIDAFIPLFETGAHSRLIDSVGV